MKKVIDFSKYSTIKIGNPVEVTVIEDDFDEKGYIIGGCSNILIGNNPPPLLILSKKYDYIKLEKNLLKVGAFTPNGKIVSFCKKHNLHNLEYLAHLPGRIGGAVKMNAGLKAYETFNNLIEIKTTKQTIKKEDIEYGYRFTKINDIILEATFEVENGFRFCDIEMFKTLRANQPSTPSAGSCFKNPPNDYAARLIEAVGLKGVKKGDVGFSEIHSNFLVNYKNGNFDDAIYMIKEAKKRVYEEFGIKLALEIIILDKDYM